MISLVFLLTQLLFGDLRLVTSDSLPAEALALAKPVGPYSSEAFQTYTSSLKSLLDEQGYWYSELVLDRVVVDSVSKRIQIDLKVTLNEPVYIHFIRYVENGTLPATFLNSAIRFNPGRIATLGELNRLRSRLHTLDDLVEVSEPRLITEDGLDGLLFSVKPASRHRSDVLIGYADQEVIGVLALQFRHLISPGSRFDVRFHRLKAYQNRLDVTVGVGFASGNFNLYQQDSTFFTRAWMLGADMALTTEYSLGVWAEQQTTTLGVNVPGLDAEAGTRILTGLRLRWNSMSGRRVDVTSGVGQRNGRAVRTATADWALEIRPEQRIHWMWSGSSALMLSERIPIDNLYRFGGATSFRGYREDELQSTRYVWSEMETRYRLDSQSFAFIFAGSAALPESSVLFNTGIGFSTPTRLGPLRFTYAGSSQRGLLQGVVHVSLSNDL